MSSISAILRDIVTVIDDILGTEAPRVFRRRGVMKCAFSPSQLEVWKQVETMEEKALEEEKKASDASEKKFFDILSKQFGKESNKFFDDPETQKAIAALSDPENWYFDKEGKPHRPKPAVWNKYKKGAEAYFGANLAKKVKTRLTITLKDIYKVVKELNASGVLQVPFKWTATDKSSTDKLAKDVMYWVSDANGRHFEPAVADTTRKVMSQGLGFRETEDEMKKALGAKYKDKSDSYWYLMGSVGVQRARSFSKLSAFEDGGVTEYEIFAVLDNRTTPQCRYMNGRVFSLSHGQAIRDNTEAAQIPEQVRNVYPWVRYSSSRAAAGLNALYVNKGGTRVYLPESGMKPNAPTQPVKGAVNASQQKTLNALVPLPPYHGHCRTSYVITEKAIQQLTQERVEEKKQIGQPPFDISKFNEIPGPSGSHGAYWKTDPKTGKDYLVKPPSFGTGDADPWLNYCVNELMKEVGLPAPDFFVSTDKGRPVSIQSKLSISGDMNGADVTALTKGQVLDIQKQFIFDWVVGNFDGNRDNHALDRKTDGIVGIDKGQAFKFFGFEKLDGKTKPSNNFGRPLFYDVLDAYRKGAKVEFSESKSKEIQDFFKKIKEIPDERIKEIFMPYATRAEAQKVKWFDFNNRPQMDFDAEIFFDLLTNRKNDVDKDIGQLYAAAEKERKKVLAPPKPKPKPKPKKKRKEEKGLPIGDRVEDDIPFLDSQLLKEAVKAGADGKAFLIGGRDFHNAQMIAYKVGGKGQGRGVHLEGRLSRSASNRLMKFLKNFADDPPDDPGRDEYFDEQILPIIKSVKAHMDPNHSVYDGKVPEKTAQKWRQSWADVQRHQKNLDELVRDKLITQEQYDHDSKKWKYYSDQLRKIGLPDKDFFDDNAEFNWNVNTLLKATFEPYKEPVVKQTKKETPEGFDDVKKETRFEWARKRTKTNKLNTSTATEKFKWSDGEMYTFKMGDVEFEFTPEDPYNPIAVQRRLVVRVKNEAKQNAKDLQQIMKDFSEKVGIELRPASSDDMELAYLRKYAVQRGVEDDWKRTAPKDLPVMQQLERLRAEAANIVGVSVKELLDRETYDFKANYRSGNGWAIFGKRFEMTLDEFNKKFKGVTLQHNLFSGTKGTAKRLLDGIVAMESTEEKLRKGLVHPSRLNGGGMSPLADRKSGGADYHFCRISKNRNYGQVVYNRRLLLELDSNSYPEDNYGAQRGDYRWTGRNKTLQDMISSIDKGSNETNPFKSVPYADFIEVIQVGNEADAQALIENLKKAGIETLGGRPVEERVVSDQKGQDWKNVMSRTAEGDFLP